MRRGGRRAGVAELHLLMKQLLHAAVLVLLLLQIHQLSVYQRVELRHVHTVAVYGGRRRCGGGRWKRRVGVGVSLRVRVEGVSVHGEESGSVERSGHCERSVG